MRVITRSRIIVVIGILLGAAFFLVTHNAQVPMAPVPAMPPPPPLPPLGRVKGWNTSEQKVQRIRPRVWSAPIQGWMSWAEFM